MDIYLMPLSTKVEIQDPYAHGYGYAKLNRDKWIKINNVSTPLDEFCGYDVSKTRLLVDGKAYLIFRDYLVEDEGIRLYIGFDHTNETDDETIVDEHFKNLTVFNLDSPFKAKKYEADERIEW